MALAFADYVLKHYGQKDANGKVWTDDTLGAETSTPVATITKYRMFVQEELHKAFLSPQEVIAKWLTFHPEDIPHTHIQTGFGLQDVRVDPTSGIVPDDQQIMKLNVGMFRKILAQNNELLIARIKQG